METKRCRRCNEIKPVADFHTSKRGDTVTYRHPCRKCSSAQRKTEYAEGRTWRGPDASYAQLLKREYGLTLDEYNNMLRKQAHRCAVCRRPETQKMAATGKMKRLAVDHDHVTGAVRGLLCQRCNVLVWAMEDNHTTLVAIGAYIEGFRKAFADGDAVPR